MDDDAGARDFLEHHEVVQVPVQYARHAELAQFVQLQPQRTRRQVHLLGDADEVGQPRALQRHAEAAAQVDQVLAAAVVGGDHRQAGEPALGRFGLERDRQAAAEAELDAGQAVDHLQLPR